MQTSTPNIAVQQPRTVAEDQWLRLRSLGLGDDALLLLRTQGYIEIRQDRGAPYSRLRFRRAGVLQSVELGCDQRQLEQVRAELSALQAPHRGKRAIRHMVQTAKQTLRQAKQKLAPALSKMGYHYHGDSIRKFRSPRPIAFSKH